MAEQSTDDVTAACETLGSALDRRGLTVAVAESLTGGNLAAQLSRASGAGDWFRGGVVAYHAEVKYRLLEVPPGPVVSEAAARRMAESTARLLDAQLVVAVTGEAGPVPQEESPGTVWFGIFDRGAVSATRRTFDGDPGDIIDRTIAEAVGMLVERVHADDPT